MKKHGLSKFSFFVLCGVLMLAGCVSNDTQTTSRTASTRSASKPYVSRSGGSGLSPLEAHERARKMVDPGDTSATHRYTYLAEDYQKRIAGNAGKAPRVPGMVMPRKKPQRSLGSALPALIAKITNSSPAQAVSSAPEPAAKPVKMAAIPEAKPVPKKVVEGQSKTRKMSSGVRVTSVRVGKHPDKTRIVLDVSGNAAFDYKMDNKKNVLVVTLKGASWSTDVKRVFSNHPLLLAYLAKPRSNGDTFLAIKMKKPAQLLFKTTYPPSSGKSYRIVFDVAPA